jgi:hypothetical protein
MSNSNINNTNSLSPFVGRDSATAKFRRFSGRILRIAGLLVLAIALASCNREDEIDLSKIDFSNIEDLYKQPLPVIQKCIQGKWKVDVEYVRGTRSIIHHENTFIEFTEDKYIFDNGLKVNTVNYFWKKEYDQTADFTTYVIRNKTTNNFLGYFVSIKNDTLDYNRFDFPQYPNTAWFVDPNYGYLLVKIK